MKDNTVRTRYVIISFIFLLTVIMLMPLTQAAASSIPESSFTLDFENRELWVNVGTNTEIFYELGTADAAPKSWESVKEADFVAKTVDGAVKKFAVIDLGWVSVKKDNYLYLRGNVDQEVTKLFLQKQDKLKVTFCGKLTAKNDASNTWKNLYSAVVDGAKKYPYFNDDSGYFMFNLNDTEFTELDTIQWKKGVTGQWKKLNELNLSIYKAKGTSLVFRIVKENGYYSNEVTVKYAKQASVPSAAVDGGKLTIALKNTQEYTIKKADGTWTAWTTPVFAGTKTSGKVDLSALGNVTGDGITTALSDITLKVRTKATEKKIASKERLIEIPATTAPVSGKSGIVVEQKSGTDITKGLVVKNNSKENYEYAVLDRKVSGTLTASSVMIQNIDLNAGNKDAGYVRWATVKAGKESTINYSKFEDFKDSYLVVIRKASVKENSKEDGVQFRLASMILAVGDAVPVSDTVSQTYTSVTYPVTKTVNFTIEPGTKLYTSLNGADFTENTANKVDYTVKEKGKVVINAYTKKTDTEEISRMVHLEFVYE